MCVLLASNGATWAFGGGAPMGIASIGNPRPNNGPMTSFAQAMGGGSTQQATSLDLSWVLFEIWVGDPLSKACSFCSTRFYCKLFAFAYPLTPVLPANSHHYLTANLNKASRHGRLLEVEALDHQETCDYLNSHPYPRNSSWMLSSKRNNSRMTCLALLPNYPVVKVVFGLATRMPLANHRNRAVLTNFPLWIGTPMVR